ncbi:hypothetical protein KTAU_11750 [Thermogemmatispora aurantia]|uniref:Uncharacterized protein n=1 Tax=Thermogemmatispora aurantia TaxID=2045279 RepID=A0A5J4JZS0_9CHLR|nr:hypothetical protein KTAU_11750 [Thermogemmatispora aurantia]
MPITRGTVASYNLARFSALAGGENSRMITRSRLSVLARSLGLLAYTDSLMVAQLLPARAGAANEHRQ